MANGLAQKEEVNLYVEIHINAGGGTGSEVLVTGHSAVANQYAAKICSSLSQALGIPNRGVKSQNLIVLNKTSMPAVLVECLFADSSDSSKYNAEVIAGAIADGLAGAGSVNGNGGSSSGSTSGNGYAGINSSGRTRGNGYAGVDDSGGKRGNGYAGINGSGRTRGNGYVGVDGSGDTSGNGYTGVDGSGVGGQVFGSSYSFLSGPSWKLGWNRNNIGWWYCTNVAEGYYYTMQNGWKCIDGEWYIFDEQGYALENTWYYDENEGHWYYLDENCRMVSGQKDKPLWKWIDGGCYAFDEDGRMYCNCTTPDGWTVDESGAWNRN